MILKLPKIIIFWTLSFTNSSTLSLQCLLIRPQASGSSNNPDRGRLPGRQQLGIHEASTFITTWTGVRMSLFISVRTPRPGNLSNHDHLTQVLPKLFNGHYIFSQSVRISGSRTGFVPSVLNSVTSCTPASSLGTLLYQTGSPKDPRPPVWEPLTRTYTKTPL